MGILKDLTELTSAKVISDEVAQDITDYYQSRSGRFSNKLFVVFGILGAVLVGLGIILIVAHNWDDLSKFSKTILAFLPMLLGQVACAYALLKRKDSVAWREGAASFLFFTVGACISLVSQIYHIPGDLGSFMFTWMIMCLPLIYLMRSSMSSILYIAGSVFYAVHNGYSYGFAESYWFWLMLLAVIPHYYLLFRQREVGNFLTWHNWILPIALIITLGILGNHHEELMFIAYMSLFGFFFMFGTSRFFNQQKLINNGYVILGSLGTVVILLMLSFDWFWQELRDRVYEFSALDDYTELIVILILTASAMLFYLPRLRTQVFREIPPFAHVFLVFILIFVVGLFSSAALILVNLLVFVLGVLTLRSGAKKNHLGILNYGLLIITALVVCRFFDEDISFVIRGALFVAVGVGFFFTNYLILKKRRTNDE